MLWHQNSFANFKIHFSLVFFLMFFSPFLNWSLYLSFRTFPSFKWLEWISSYSMCFYHFTWGGTSHYQALKKRLLLSVLQFLNDYFKISCKVLTFQNTYNAHFQRISFVSVVMVENLTWKYKNLVQNINSSYWRSFTDVKSQYIQNAWR